MNPTRRLVAATTAVLCFGGTGAGDLAVFCADEDATAGARLAPEGVLAVVAIAAAAQRFVMASLGAVVGVAADKALIQGAWAAGQPLGLLSAPGIASAIGASMTWTKAVTAVANVENANAVFAPQATGWAVSSDAALLLRGRERAAGSGFILDDDYIANRRAVVSNSVPSLSAIYGDWSQLLLGTGGVIEIGVDPYGINSALFTKGLIGVRAVWTCDVGVLQGAAFSTLRGSAKAVADMTT